MQRKSLAVPVEPVARLDPSGFDPSREDTIEGLRYLIERFSEGDEYCDTEIEILANARTLIEQDWRKAIIDVFSHEGVLEFMSKGLRVGGYPMTDKGLIPWSEWFLSKVDIALAIATEARRAETSSGSVHEGAGPQDIAQPQSVSGLSHTGGDRG